MSQPTWTHHFYDIPEDILLLKETFLDVDGQHLRYQFSVKIN